MTISKEKQEIIRKQRKEQILAAALALFDEKGFAETKISDISERAGISKGLIYHYFATKEEILLCYREPLIECLQECREQETGLDCLALVTLRLLSYPYYKDYIPPLRIIFTAVIRGEIPKETLVQILGPDFGGQYFGELIERCQREGSCREGDPCQLGRTYWHYIMGCMVEMSLLEDKASFQLDFDYLATLLQPQNL